jgi:hypothetical protein
MNIFLFLSIYYIYERTKGGIKMEDESIDIGLWDVDDFEEED